MSKIKAHLCPFSFSGEEADALSCPGHSWGNQASDNGWQRVCMGWHWNVFSEVVVKALEPLWFPTLWQQSLEELCMAAMGPSSCSLSRVHLVGYSQLWAGLWGLGSWQGHSGQEKHIAGVLAADCPVPAAWKLSWPNASFSDIWTSEKRGKNNPLICRCVRTKKRSMVRKKSVHFQSCWDRIQFCSAKILTN